jgi:hypothetical protein
VPLKIGIFKNENESNKSQKLLDNTDAHFQTEITGELDTLMRKPTSTTQLATFLFVYSRWHEPHDAVQCRAQGSTFEFLFQFQTEFFWNFLFDFQVVRASNRSTI